MGILSSLSYDGNIYCFWLVVGLYKKYKVFVYKYMILKDFLIGMF